MDFYMTEQDIIEKREEIEKDKIIKPFLTYVDYSAFENYLQSAEYNDPILNKFLGIKLYSIIDSSLILSQENDDIKLR